MARKSPGDGAAAWKGFEALLAVAALPPFFVLYGKERYFIREAVARLKPRIVPSPDMDDLLFRSVSASEWTGVEIADLARSAPFFDGTQLIVVRDSDKLKEEDQKGLLDYARDPAPFTHVVLLAGEEAPKGSLFSYLKSRHPDSWLAFQGLKRAACSEWVRRMAKEKGLAPYLTPEILEGLVETGQVSLGTLERQLSILALYVQGLDRSRISEDLPFGMPEIALQQSYRFTDPLLQGELGQALEILDRLVGQGVSPLVLLSRIAWEMRKIWRIKDELDKGPLSDAFLRAIRVQPFKKAVYVSVAGRLSWEVLGGILVSVTETEGKLKGSRLDPQFHLEELCGRIGRLVAAGPAEGLRRSGGRSGRN